jgi:Pentapeptide repeats (8 copies)
MMGNSPWTRFRQGVSHDLQKGAHRLGPAVPRVLQRLAEVGRKGLARVRGMSWHAVPRGLKAVFLCIVASLLLSGITFAVWKIPQWQAASWESLAERKDLPKLENDARTTLVQAVGGAILLIGLFFTWWSISTAERNLQITHETATQNLAIALDGQITERFTRAIEQLGSDQLEVRLGAISALERIARDSERDHWPIMEILTAYVREHAPWPPKAQPPEEQQPGAPALPPLAADIQAVLTVLRRLTRTYGKGEDQVLDLRRTDLPGANLTGAHLEEAQLWQAYLEEAELWGAHLEGATLWGAFLKGAILTGAHLGGVHLDHAYLERAHLEGAINLTVEQLSKVRTLTRRI